MQQRSEGTRQNILETALGLFARHGYAATGVAEICHAAGVSKGAFYHHFPSKHELFLDLLKGWLAQLDEKLAAILRADQPVPQTLIQMAGELRWVFSEARGNLPMFLEFWLQASRDPQVWEAAIAPYHRYQAYFKELIQRGIDEGSLRPVDAENAARTLVSIAMGVLLQGLLDPHGADWPAIAQDSISILLEKEG